MNFSKEENKLYRRKRNGEKQSSRAMHHKGVRIWLAAMAVGLLGVGAVHPVKAAAFSISKTQVTLTKGTSKKLKVSNLPSKNAKVKWTTSNKYAATVSKKGKISAMNYGVATIRAICKGKTVTCKVTVPDTTRNVVLNVYSVTLTEGSTYQLQATSAKKVKYHSANKDIATVSAKGVIRAVNPGTTVITAKSSRGVARCTVTVTSADTKVDAPTWMTNKKAVAIRRLTKNNNLVYDNITWAKGKNITFKIANLDESTVKKCVWSSEDTEILSTPETSDESKIQAAAITQQEGTVTVSATVTDVNGKVTTYTNTVSVTNPVLNTKNLVLFTSAAGTNRQRYVSFSGLSKYSSVTWSCTNKSQLTYASYKSKAAVWGLKPGTGTIKASVDGKNYEINYTVLEPKFGNTSFLISAGKTKKIAMSGIDGVTPVYSSRNTGIATVSEDGVITTKKAGVTYVDVTLENMVYSYRVEVRAKGVKTIVKRAKYILKHWTYNQNKRMKDGYYDCSALVWKGYQAYKNYQKKLSNVGSALSAGELFDYLYSENQIIYFGYMNVDDLKAGDLIFYGDYDNAVKYSTPGRTLDIYHVSMYAGQGKIVEIGNPSIDGNSSKYIVGIGRVLTN